MTAPGRPLTEGERWARDELEALLAQRLAPRAIGRFLVASQRRADAVRAARPQTARRARRWSLAGAAAYAARAAADPRPGAARRLAADAAWWTATWAMLEWHLGMLETGDGRPRELGAADAATLARTWMVPLAARGAGPALCLAAWASDGLDGRLARASEPTRLGRDLEGLVDACFAAAALRGARRADAIPGAAVVAELARLAAGIAYAAGVYFGRAEAPDPAVARAGRQATPLRVAGLVAAGLGRRRAAGTLVGAGALWGVAGVVRARVVTLHT